VEPGVLRSDTGIIQPRGDGIHRRIWPSSSLAKYERIPWKIPGFRW
jgi:hypothetical protein